MTISERLRGLQMDRIDNDDMIELSAHADMLLLKYNSAIVEPPEWLKDASATLTKAIVDRRHDMLSMRLKEIQAKKTALRTREQKVNDLNDEEARLKQALGL